MTHVECMCGWAGTSETWASHVCWGGGRPLANGIVTPPDAYAECSECGTFHYNRIVRKCSAKTGHSYQAAHRTGEEGPK